MTDPVASPFAKVTEKEERWRGYLDGIRAGNSDALAKLYDETSSLLYGLALRVLNDPSDAEEVVLDVYQQVWRSTHTFDPGRGTVWGWLAVLARSRAIDRLRSMGSRRARELPIEDGFETRSTSPVPEVETIFAEERKLVRPHGALAFDMHFKHDAIALAGGLQRDGILAPVL